MSIEQLHLHNLRCFQQQRFHFDAKHNFICADNGKGKTSLLEAIYLLSCGHSFRTRETPPLIHHGADAFTLYARLADGNQISLQKSLLKDNIIKVNDAPCLRTSDLAYYLPCQIYYQDIFAILDAGPLIRRSLLDWGVFHVEHSYHQGLKEYRYNLKNRNALLKQKREKSEFTPWNQTMDRLAEQLHQQRRTYIEKLNVVLQSVLAELVDFNCSISYEKGWDRRKENISYAEQLEQDFARDLLKGYTHSGIQQADLTFKVEGNILAKKTLSRGQQKMLLLATKIAQTLCLEKPCVHLFDDVFAEVDAKHSKKIIEYILGLDGQVFISLLPNSANYIREGQRIDL